MLNGVIYNYSNNNPVKYVDPDGKMKREVERGQSSRNIDKVDKGHIPNQEPHVQNNDGSSSTQSGKHQKHQLNKKEKVL